MALKDLLSRTFSGTNLITKYLQTIKTMFDELAIINAPLDEDDLLIHLLDGLRYDFKELSAAIRARETHIIFEELQDKLVDHETFLK